MAEVATDSGFNFNNTLDSLLKTYQSVSNIRTQEAIAKYQMASQAQTSALYSPEAVNQRAAYTTGNVTAGRASLAGGVASGGGMNGAMLVGLGVLAGIVAIKLLK